jgi:hypothetical protein
VSRQTAFALAACCDHIPLFVFRSNTVAAHFIMMDGVLKYLPMLFEGRIGKYVNELQFCLIGAFNLRQLLPPCVE